MTKLVSTLCKSAVIMGMFGALSVVSNSLAQERIRLNPEYKAPTEDELATFDDDLFTGDISEDFNQFLNVPEESEQFIQLTEPTDRDTKIVSLEQGDQKKAPVIQLDHEYQSNNPILFSISPTAISSGMDQGSFPNNAVGSQLVLSINPSGNAETPFYKPRKLELSLGSSFVGNSTSRYNPVLFNGFGAQRAYNLSLGLNYSGFNIGASISRDTTLYMPQLRGFDLGFGYSGESWSANFRIGEYSRSGEPLLIGSDLNTFENVSAYELGAAYRLFSNVNLTGRFTYYSYGIGNEVAPLDDVQSLIFGTNLSF